MAMSCLLAKISASQCFSRGLALRAVKNLCPRSSTVLSNRDWSHFNQYDSSKTKFNLNHGNHIVPLPTAIFARSSANSYEGKQAAHKHHNHVMIWKLERILSAVLLPVIPAALISPSQMLDTVVAVLIVMHTHWGLEAIVVDYIRPILFGDLAPKIGLGLLYVFSIVMLAGLLNLIYNDCGLANAIIHIWKS